MSSRFARCTALRRTVKSIVLAGKAKLCAPMKMLELSTKTWRRFAGASWPCATIAVGAAAAAAAEVIEDLVGGGLWPTTGLGGCPRR